MTNSILEYEIKQQPEVLATILKEEASAVEEVSDSIAKFRPSFISFVARGTSDNAARYGQYLFGSLNRLPAGLATPALFTLYKTPPRMDGGLVVGISQSGQSPDVVEVVYESKRQGALTIAITNDSQSPLAKAAEFVLQLHTGEERSVAASKTYTASLLILAMISTALSGKESLRRVLLTIPEQVANIITRSDQILEIANEYRTYDSCMVIGRGFNYATAFEISLKLKELSRVLADPYSPADFQHGPVALVESGFPVLVIATQGKVLPELTRFLMDLKRRKINLLLITDKEQLMDLGGKSMPLVPSIQEWASPILNVIPGQLFALRLAIAKGFDPDNPRGLTKITLTR